MRRVNIGITVSLEEASRRVWSNGILQNVFNFARTLKNSQEDYNVFLLNVQGAKVENLPWQDDVELNCYTYDEIKDDINLLFILGSHIYEDWANYLQKRGCKIVAYHCGSNYIVDMESCIFKNEEEVNPTYPDYCDETWIIPQNEEMNIYYFKVMERSRVTRVVPFVWSSFFIDRDRKELQLPNDGFYHKKGELKSLAIMEPNIDVIKFCVYPMLIAETLYRIDKGLFKYLYVTNADNLKNNKYFRRIVNSLDLVIDNVASFEARYRITFFLNKYADVLVSHQWGNPLNYMYLDALYLGYPLVHNAHIIKEAGYYYSGNNVEEGAVMLRRAIENHDDNLEEYNHISGKVLEKYSYDNSSVIAEYDLLIDHVLRH